MTQSAAVAVISILLALIVKAALESMFKPIFEAQKTWQDIQLIAWFQVFVFYVMTFRFYIGSIRYGEVEPKNLDMLIKSWNVIGAFLLFSNLYAIALAAPYQKYFYLLMIALHIVDLVWFFIAFVLLKLRPVSETQLQVGEVKMESLQSIMLTFIGFDVATLVLAGLLFYVLPFAADITAETATVGDWLFLAVLAVISVIDFWAYRDLYFSFDQWKVSNCKSLKR